MNIDDPKIIALKSNIEIAFQEFALAIKYHEALKVALYDKELHRRLGTLVTDDTFRTILDALRREALLALMRLWDKDTRTIGINVMADNFRCDCVINALINGLADDIKQSLIDRKKEIIELVDKYSANGSQYAVIVKLRKLRNSFLAHRQAGVINIDSTTNDEIEYIYQDTLRLISLLLSLIKRTGCDPNAFTKNDRVNAENFWNAWGENRIPFNLSDIPVK
jgi:hypothetical protein